MLFLFLTTIGASMILQRRVQQEFDDDPGWLIRRKRVKQLEAQFDIENQALDQELTDLLESHRALVAKRDLPALSLYDEAMDELERDLATDPLEEKFRSLERDHGKKKKEKKSV